MFVTSCMTTAVFLMILIIGTRIIHCEQQGHYDSSKEVSGLTVQDKQVEKTLPVLGECNDEWTKQYNAEVDGYALVNCGRCYIHQLQVWANSNAFQGPRKCRGMTPELFSSRQECLLKNNCILRYSPSLIVWSPSNEPICIGEEPGTLDVGYSCLDSEMAIDDVIKGSQIVESAQGLIRSHNYDVGSRATYPRELPKHVMIINPPASQQISWQNYYVMLYVLTSDIDNGDVLIMRDSSLDISNDVCEISTWRTGSFHNVTTTTLHLEFLLGSSSEHGQGFDICFQWFEVGNANAKTIFEKTIEACKQPAENKKEIPIFDVIKNTRTQEQRGIIRSHSIFPWNYPRPVSEDSTSIFNKWSSHAHVLLAPTAMVHLEIHVQSLDIGWGDHLFISSPNKNVSDQDLKKTNPHYFAAQTSVTLNFSVFHSTMHTGSGFMLCYQWYKTSLARSPLDNLCEEFAYHVDPCERRARKERQGKKKLRKKCGLKTKKQIKKGSKAKENRQEQKNQKNTKHTKRNHT